MRDFLFKPRFSITWLFVFMVTLSVVRTFIHA